MLWDANGFESTIANLKSRISITDILWSLRSVKVNDSAQRILAERSRSRFSSLTVVPEIEPILNGKMLS